MTRRSIMEYAQAIRERYYRAVKQEKGKILDEFAQVTGLHRKAAIRLLKRLGQPKTSKRRGQPRRYGADVQKALKGIWEAGDRLCSKRLQPFLPEMVKILRQHGEQHINASLESELCRMSVSTIDRLLRPYRRLGGRRGLSTTKPGSLLRSCIPIRTFADWQENKPGFVEIDLVAHCGESTEDFYLNTLCAVDVATGWTECLPVWGKGQGRVKASVHRARQRLPFPLLGIDSDNGSEFINQSFYTYCKDENITFTRSRPYKKNDSCHVEQKNGNIVRRMVGYDRYNSKAAYECLDRLYYSLRLYVNFFQPVLKLQKKTRIDAKVKKVYDEAKTPYQRVLASPHVSQESKDRLTKLYGTLDPVKLQKSLEQRLRDIWDRYRVQLSSVAK